MKIKLADENVAAEKWLPEVTPDGSEIGANYADAYVKPMNKTLDDGTEVRCKRRGLKITVQVGERKGEAHEERGNQYDIEDGPQVEPGLKERLDAGARAAESLLEASDRARGNFFFFF